MSECKNCNELNLIIDTQLIELEEIKPKYNALVQRFNKAEQYLNNNPDCEKWIPEVQKIVRELSDIINHCKDIGYIMTSDEILNGFKEGSNV